MSDGLMLTIGEDGVAREYKDDYDVVIHCETKEDQDKVLAILNRQTSEWIMTERKGEGWNDLSNITCEKCGCEFKRFILSLYCPQCGAFMKNGHPMPGMEGGRDEAD